MTFYKNETEPVKADHIEKYNALYKRCEAEEIPKDDPKHISLHARLEELYKSSFPGLVQNFAYAPLQRMTDLAMHRFLMGMQEGWELQVEYLSPEECKAYALICVNYDQYEIAMKEVLAGEA